MRSSNQDKLVNKKTDSKDKRGRAKNLFQNVRGNATLEMLGQNEKDVAEEQAEATKLNEKEKNSEIGKTAVKAPTSTKIKSQTPRQKKSEKNTKPEKPAKKPKTVGGKKPVRNRFQILCYLEPEDYAEFDEMFTAVRKELIVSKGIKLKESNLASMVLNICKEELFDKNKEKFVDLVSRKLEK